MHRSRRLRGGGRGRLGLRLGRVGVSPLLRHSPVRAPPPEDDGRALSALERAPDHGRYEVYVGNWPDRVHELELAALFSKYSICVSNVHLHRLPMYSYAFVELTCGEDVVRAIDLLHGGKVLGHQIVVRRARPPAGRQPPAEYRHQALAVEELDDEEDCESPAAEPCPPDMPPLVMPPQELPSVRRLFSDRDAELYGEVPSAKRVCRGPGGADSAPLDMTLDSDSGLQSGHSSATHLPALPDRIRQRLHEPTEVVVANFPSDTSELDLMDVFSRFKPISVRIMASCARQPPEDFTYAYVTVRSTMLADSAVQELDGRLYRGHHLVVEARISS